MKNIIRWLLLLLVSLPAYRLAAQILDINQFKITVYHQTNAAPPTLPDFPNAYFFSAYIDTDSSYDVTHVTVYPSSSVELVLNQQNPTYFENGTPYYSNETNFDTDYPGGTYDYNFDFSDSFGDIFNGDIYFDISVTDLYATSVPAFTPACWSAMQAVDPGRDFTLSWNNYTLAPGADYAETFLSIRDHNSGSSVIGPNGPPEITSTNIPAGTLQYGHVYDVSLYFSERQTPVDYGNDGAQVTVGWDNLTQTTLATRPLWLNIALAGEDVRLTWPAYAASYHLQSSSQVSSGVWNNVTNSPVLAGTTNSVDLPVAGTAVYFRLAGGPD